MDTTMKKILLFNLTILILLFTACSKEWLDAKRDISLIVPTTLEDMRLLMNNDGTFVLDGRVFAELAADDYYLLEDQLNSTPDHSYRNSYLWLDELYTPELIVADWNVSYEQVFITNIVLKGLEKIEPTLSTQTEYSDVKGAALFFRAKAFFNLTETFAKPYDPATAHTDLGIPLRFNPDINAPIERATVQETWDRIILDLKEAAKLLKPLPTVITNASRCTANALLARIYLCLQDYEQALYHATESLKDKNDLLDYNTLNLAATYPVTRFNKETMIYSEIAQYSPTFMTINSRTQRELYDSYDDADLRKQVFFRVLPDGEFGFRGTYAGNVRVFTGFSVNEMFITRAECYARLGDVDAAMDDLNALLVKRYKENEFIPLTASDKAEALQIVLQERRKELLRRGLRWSDIRRLNKETQFQKTFTRTWQGTTYTLTPERISNYASPFPYNTTSVK